MLSKERKLYLIDAIVKFEEVEGWCKSLHSSQDVEFLQSKGFVGFRLAIMLWVVLPILWAIQTGFNGVPYLVSFLKRRFKRTRPQEKKEKIRKRREKKGNPQVSKSVKIKCCKGCVPRQLENLSRRKYTEMKKQTVDGAGPNTRKNYLKRLRKKARRQVYRESVESKMHKESHYVADFATDYSQASFRTRTTKREDRKRRRFLDMTLGNRFVSKDGLFPLFSKAPRRQVPGWAERQFLHHYEIVGDAVLCDGKDVLFDLLSSPDGPVVYNFISSFDGRHNVNAGWSVLYRRIINSGRFKQFWSSSHSSSSSRRSGRSSRWSNLCDEDAC